MRLTLRNVRPWGGACLDVAMADGSITAIGPCLPRTSDEFDGGGAVLLPGLHDHHLHILATAARRQSVGLAGLATADEVRASLKVSAAASPPGQWLRAVDYDERAAGLPDRALLDSWVPDRPVRLQDRTGALWVLNDMAMALLADRNLPAGAERDRSGQPTGRFWREDRWLGQALPGATPDLAALGSELAALGLTGLTDAGAQNGPEEAAMLGSAHVGGALPQQLVLMGREDLPKGTRYRRGPLKLLIDERDPPDLGELSARILVARGQNRTVAAHCVTEAELALFLAALAASGGACAGDRIEHGGMIPEPFIPVIAGQGLTVVTNPAFIHDRGDRYRATVAEARWDELYRGRSLAAAGIPLAAGSDAPYASHDPWLAMRTSRDRLTAAGAELGIAEVLDAAAALGLYLSNGLAPGGPARLIAPGASADLMLCTGTLEDVLADLTTQRVSATIIMGKIAFSRD